MVIPRKKLQRQLPQHWPSLLCATSLDFYCVNGSWKFIDLAVTQLHWPWPSGKWKVKENIEEGVFPGCNRMVEICHLFTPPRGYKKRFTWSRQRWWCLSSWCNSSLVTRDTRIETINEKNDLKVLWKKLNCIVLPFCNVSRDLKFWEFSIEKERRVWWIFVCGHFCIS